MFAKTNGVIHNKSKSQPRYESEHANENETKAIKKTEWVE